MAQPSTEGTKEGSDAARERAQALIGRTISDRYKILDLIAMGGMGGVYRAQHLHMRKRVAIKVLHPETEGFPELVSRFEREAVAAAHIDHPNVAIASDFGKFDGECRFMVLELIRGSTLRELMDRGPFVPDRAARIARQIAIALGAVHKKGIVHRDVKPRNIMIIDDTRRTRRVRNDPRAGEDVVKLIDFGLAKVPVDEISAPEENDPARRDLTQAGVVMGTIGYLAPEAALGMGSVGEAADLYSVGVILYEMLCGKPPFEADSSMKVFALHRTRPVPPIAERNPSVHVPPELEAIARKLLEKEPDDRYPSADALVEALDHVISQLAPSSLPGVSSRRGGAGPSVAPTSKRGEPSSTSPVSKRSRSLSSSGSSSDALLPKPTPSRSVAPPAGRSASSAPSGQSSADIAKMKGGGKSRVAWIVALVVVVASIIAVVATRGSSDSPQQASVVDRLRVVAEAKDSSKAIDTFLELAEKERGAFNNRAVQNEAAAVAELVAPRGAAADPVFDRLATGLGSDGLDILYDLAAREPRPTDSPTSAGARARKILAKPEAMAQATPAMRVAYELRAASCVERPNLFSRAGQDGDDRALSTLTSMLPPACPRPDACCYEKNRDLERAIANIQARLRR